MEPPPAVAYRDPTAWLGMKDSNSEMSPQNIPLKGRADFRESGRISPRRLFACELRGWGYAAGLRAKISAETLVRVLVTRRMAEMAGIAAIFCPLQR
jgi:hypothetical protein